MADVTVTLTPVPSAYTTFAEYVVAGYWDDGYVVSYACAYTVTGMANVYPTGVSATGSIGTVTVTGTANAYPTGVRAIGVIGDISVWRIIDDSQTPNWAGIVIPSSDWVVVPDGQVPGWTPVNDAQTPTWTAVPDTQSPNWQQVAA